VLGGRKREWRLDSTFDYAACRGLVDAGEGQITSLMVVGGSAQLAWLNVCTSISGQPWVGRAEMVPTIVPQVITIQVAFACRLAV